MLGLPWTGGGGTPGPGRCSASTLHAHTHAHSHTEPGQRQGSPSGAQGSENSTQSHPRGHDTCRVPQPPGQKPSPPLPSPTRRGRRDQWEEESLQWLPLEVPDCQAPVNPVGQTQWERLGRSQDPGLGKQTGSGGRWVGVSGSFDEGAVAGGVPGGQYYLLVNWASG